MVEKRPFSFAETTSEQNICKAVQLTLKMAVELQWKANVTCLLLVSLRKSMATQMGTQTVQEG